MIDNFIIKKASNRDLDRIMEIENISFASDGFSKRQFSYLITKAKGIFYTLKIKGLIVAYISLLTNSKTSNVRIYSIAVHPEMRGKNYAKSLIEKSIEYSKNNKKQTLSLEVRTDNLPAINLYEKFGFKTIKIKPNYYHDGTDANVMILEI
ncbi:MAG: ribosomal protein S18-alanine N-acetyltransferase [Bacteroidales bacterium]|jgi:ribosomal-protein-alanine acetyltransferase|nr:ribosomal protein S18-alanine N-acetyltransferase [Bacteroidales bacterium]